VETDEHQPHSLLGAVANNRLAKPHQIPQARLWAHEPNYKKNAPSWTFPPFLIVVVAKLLLPQGTGQMLQAALQPVPPRNALGLRHLLLQAFPFQTASDQPKS
jgi:hypothetical protein